MTSRSQLAIDEHFAADTTSVDFVSYLESHQPAVDEHDVAHFDVVEQIFVVYADGAYLLGTFAGCAPRTNGEIEFLARLQLDRDFDVAGANLRTFDVHHDGDFSPDLLGHVADAFDDHTGPLVIGVCHVEARDIGATENEFFQHLLALGGRTQGEDNFGLAQGTFSIAHNRL